MFLFFPIVLGFHVFLCLSCSLFLTLLNLFKMANEVYGTLFSNTHPVSGDTYQTVAPDEEAFLRTVIVPIFQVLRKV